MAISSKVKRTLEKKFSGNPELNKEVLRWKKSLEEVNRRLNNADSGGKKEAEGNQRRKYNGREIYECKF